jgi:predicted protein tyrosine phosphatase
MIINVFSLNQANEYLSKGMYIKNWISVRDYGWEHLYEIVDKNAENVLPIVFDDITKYQYENDMIHPVYRNVVKDREIIYFNEEMANQILNFSLDIWKNDGMLNIHCYAGRSRSQAIGYILNNYFNLFKEKNENDYLFNVKNSLKKFMPNHDVLKILNEKIFFN